MLENTLMRGCGWMKSRERGNIIFLYYICARGEITEAAASAIIEKRAGHTRCPRDVING